MIVGLFVPVADPNALMLYAFGVSVTTYSDVAKTVAVATVTTGGPLGIQ